jgi:hypothetical protein
MYFDYMEENEKNSKNPDFDSNLTGIQEAQNLPKTRIPGLQSAAQWHNAETYSSVCRLF